MQTYCPGFVGRHIVKTLRGQIFDRYVHLPVSYFDTNPSGVLLSKLTYNTEQVATATTDSVTVFIRDTLTILGLIGYLLYLNPKLTLISLIVEYPLPLDQSALVLVAGLTVSLASAFFAVRSSL